MISVNVGGRSYRLLKSALMRYPDTLLAKEDCIQHYYDPSRREFFFDRDPDLFRYVRGFYLTGKIHCSYEFEVECWQAYRDELEFFGIPIDGGFTPDCCLDFYLDKSTSIDHEDKTPIVAITQIAKPVKPSGLNPWRERVRRGLEDPVSSLKARFFHVFIGSVILVNVCTNAMETVHCQLDKTLGECYPTFFRTVNALCVPIFTAEYIIGVVVSLSPWQHIRQVFNVIDLMAIVPFYVNVIIEQFYDTRGKDLQIFSVLRVFRIFRVLKFARYSNKLNELFHSIRNSLHELSVLLGSYSLTVVLFSSVLFFMEKNATESSFVSIPEAMWFTIVSTTTLGYGDIVPVTMLGKIVGGLCCIIGALVISFPVPVIQAKAKGLSKASKREAMLL